MFDQQKGDKSARRASLQSILLLMGLTGLLGWSVELLLGSNLWWLVMLAIAVAVLLPPKLNPRWLMNRYRAREIEFHHAPELYKAMALLSQRAKLTKIPLLYWIPDNRLNSFTVGQRNRAAIGLTHGLLKSLSFREIVAVLAHETAHICHNDMQLMAIADAAAGITRLFSKIAVVVAVLLLPLSFFGVLIINWLALLILILAPLASSVMLQALSRTREFSADVKAAELTGDPVGLANALQRLDLWQDGLFFGLFRRRCGFGLFNSHPSTSERIERLLKLELSASDTENWSVTERIDLPKDFAKGLKRSKFWF